MAKSNSSQPAAWVQVRVRLPKMTARTHDKVAYHQRKTIQFPRPIDTNEFLSNSVLLEQIRAALAV